ncbi:MAG: hypothetical protein CFE31_15295 [Rhizobiales bacterium PAR1]|nr:MAG: hypothetical protein CFE31_15295 [Rhizobiales bacterium PAR1]
MTFAAVTAALLQLGLSQEGFMVAVAAAMEASAIFAASFSNCRMRAKPQAPEPPHPARIRQAHFYLKVPRHSRSSATVMCITGEFYPS